MLGPPEFHDISSSSRLAGFPSAIFVSLSFK